MRASFDQTAAANVLKVVYLPPIQELLNNATPLLKFIEKKVQNVPGGTDFTIPIHVSRNDAAGVGVAENGTLPTAGKQGYSKAIVPSKFLYSTISVTGPAIAATKSDKGSFLRAIESEMKGVVTDTKRAFNRQLHGDGRDVLAFWKSGATGTSIVVDDSGASGVRGNASMHLPTAALKVDLVDSDNSTVNLGLSSSDATSVTITRGAVSGTGYAATLSKNIQTVAGPATGDFFVREGTLGKQMTGIAAIISDANPPLLSGGLHGITVASNADWVAQCIGTEASKQDLSFGLMQQVFSQISMNSDLDESAVKLLLCGYQMRDTYVQLCQDQRRFYNTMKLDGGFEAVTYNGKPLVPDAQCLRNRIYFIAPETMSIYRLADMDWMDRDGSIFYRLSGIDGYGATLYVYQELGCHLRNGNGLLRGINEVTT
jgi:hypothetical protein